MDGDLLEKSVGTRCLIFSKDNQFLFMGRLAYYDKVNQTIRIDEYNRHALTSPLKEDTHIKIHVKNEHAAQTFILIEGSVERTFNNYIRITPSSVSEKKEERQSFRQNVMSESVVSFVNHKAAGDPCTIIDISATGIAIQSKSNYAVGDQLWFYNQQFRQGGPPHFVECVIVRKNALRDNQYFYGCQFIGLSTDEEDKLFCDIFALQATELQGKKE